MVAYRKATIALADEVVHLEDGRIVDRGTHAELLARSPAYAQLVNAYEKAATTTLPAADPPPTSPSRARRAHHRPTPSTAGGWTPARTSAPSRPSASA